MLPQAILEKLTEPPVLNEHLVALAWPSFSIESRIQVIDTLGQSYLGIPTWLARLALEDKAPLVRYWATRSYMFRAHPQWCNQWTDPPVSEEEKALFAKASTDSCDFVRLGALAELGYEHFDSCSQLQRLVSINQTRCPFLRNFAKWLEQALAAGMPETDLCQCVQEFFSLQGTQQELARYQQNVCGPDDVVAMQETLRKLLMMTESVGLPLRAALRGAIVRYYAPGMMTAKELSELPDDVLGVLVSRESEECSELRDLVEKHPDRFSQSVQESVKIHRQLLALRTPVEELRAMSMRERIIVNGVTAEMLLEVMLEIKERLTVLQKYA